MCVSLWSRPFISRCCCICSVREQLFEQPVPLGHCISTLLHCAAEAGSHALSKASISCLCALTHLNTEPLLEAARLTPSDDPSRISQAGHAYLTLIQERVGGGGHGKGRVLASFLPGVVTGVTKLLTSDAKVVEGVVVLGVITWARYVVLVMGGAKTEGEESAQVVGGPPQQEGRPQLVKRTEAWLEETGKRLGLLIQRMCVLVTSEVWRVRVQLVGWAHVLLHHCIK